MSWEALLSAFWLGILTAISPCPMTTNIAAISFIGRKAGQKEQVVSSGMLYSLGRVSAYALLGCLITAGLLSNAEIAQFLQKYMNQALGPILILLGLVLLGWLGAAVSLTPEASGLQKRVESGGVIWAVPIGFLFALSFCPVSAGLFFGGLIPLALAQQSSLTLPIIYGVGTAVPVIFFAFLMTFGTTYVGKAFNRLTQFESWLRTLAGTVFIFAGIYYCMIYIYGFSLERL